MTVTIKQITVNGLLYRRTYSVGINIMDGKTMKIQLIQHSNLSTCVRAVRTCWDSHDKGGCYTTPTDNITESDKKLLSRIILKHKHGSVAEHLNYTFDIDGISRSCLQELARHRHASLSVKSTRYTLKELKNCDDIEIEGDSITNIELGDSFLVDCYDDDIFWNNMLQLQTLQKCLRNGMSNDQAKYMLPEAYKTSLVWTINARSLQNFLSLRTSKSALWEIRQLAYAIYDNLPEEHKHLFTEYLYKEPSDKTEETEKIVAHITNRKNNPS